MVNRFKEYEQRRDTYKEQMDRLTLKVNHIGNARLIVILAGIGIAIGLYFNKSWLGTLNILVITFIVFLYLVFKYNQWNKKKKRAEILYSINIKGLQRLQGEWKSFPESGEDYIDEDHFFSWDLDLFGRGSLFQWMNDTVTPMGKEKLRKALIQPDKTADTIKGRQKAVQELANKIDWAQDFQVSGIIEKDMMNDPKPLLNWSHKMNDSYLKMGIGLVTKILPALTLLSIIAAFTITNFSYMVPAILFTVQIVLAVIGFSVRNDIMSSAGKYREDIKVYEKLICQLEKSSFKSPYIKQLQKGLQSDKEESVTQQMKKLDGVLDMVSMRHIQFYIIFNILTLWDYQCVIALERWKKKYGKNLKQWLESVGDVEALLSIGMRAYEQHQWEMPEITKERKVVGHDLGHPLLNANERVANTIQFGGNKNVLLITGSNMSGKSTFLRTVGINLVLAYSGAPVCAKKFCCPIMSIYTSMRVKDDLENKISSFYAELIRIKKIVETASQGKEVFFLLDEIFKGTNSRDRHIGAKALIRTLSKQNTLGLVSTHDLELAELAEESGARIANYHFREHYKDNKICFDYTLNSGVSTTFNAIYLMKQIGIDIQE